MKLKYQDDLSRFTDCPPAGCLSRAGTVFYLVFKEDTNKNFIPRAKTNVLAAGRCSGYGLSFWDTQENLLNNFISKVKNRKVEKEGKTIQKKYHVPPAIGTHIAELNIQASDGRMSQPNDNGHIDFHPYEGIDLHERIINYFSIPQS